MMETSGHGAMRSNYYLDDGSHLALTAVVAYVRSKLKSGGECHDTSQAGSSKAVAGGLVLELLYCHVM